jgi:cytochrome c-type biogenesis protein
MRTTIDIIFAWIIAYAISGVGNLYNRIRTFEVWFRRVIALLFIGVGIYYIITVFL